MSAARGGLIGILRGLTRGGRRRAYLDRLPEILEEDWRDFTPSESTLTPGVPELREVECVRCPKFRSFPARCSVPFGSRLRSCITASTELHLRGLAGKRVLELGCGESSFARKVVELGGGTWIGVDQVLGRSDPSRFVHSIQASVPYLPFRDESFDVVFGTEAMEHFEDPFTPGDLDYRAAFDAVWRILRPGGWIYFDGPIHLHGADEFVRGDVARIRSIFDGWSDVRMLSWRRRHEPLRAHHAPERESSRWIKILGDGSEKEVEELRRRSAWILAVRASKPLTAGALVRADQRAGIR